MITSLAAAAAFLVVLPQAPERPTSVLQVTATPVHSLPTPLATDSPQREMIMAAPPAPTPIPWRERLEERLREFMTGMIPWLTLACLAVAVLSGAVAVQTIASESRRRIRKQQPSRNSGWGGWLPVRWADPDAEAIDYLHSMIEDLQGLASLAHVARSWAQQPLQEHEGRMLSRIFCIRRFLQETYGIEAGAIFMSDTNSPPLDPARHGGIALTSWQQIHLTNLLARERQLIMIIGMIRDGTLRAK